MPPRSPPTWCAMRVHCRSRAARNSPTSARPPFPRSRNAKRPARRRWSRARSRSGRLKLAFQSIASLEGDTRQHFDVLVRVIDDSGNEVHASEFIGAAEKHGLMTSIDPLGHRPRAQGPGQARRRAAGIEPVREDVGGQPQGGRSADRVDASTRSRRARSSLARSCSNCVKSSSRTMCARRARADQGIDRS